MSGADYLFARAGHGVVGSVKGLVNQSDAERLYLAENAVDLANGGGFRNPKGFDALDMDAAMRVSSAFSQGLREGVDKETILERQRQTMEDHLGNRGIDNFYNKQTQKLEEAKAYQTPGVQKAGNIAEVVGQMALPVVASFLPGGQLLGTFGSSMSAAGNTTMNALEQGADTETALQAGYLTGAKEAAVESLFGGILGRGVGLLDSTGKRLLSPKVLGALQEFGNTALGRVVRKAAASGEEGLEEVLSAYLDPYIARATYDEDAGPVTFQELKDNFGMGFIVSFLLGGIPGKTNTDTNININTNAQPNVEKSSLSGASPNATMTAKGGMQNGPKTAGRSIGIITESHGGLGAGTDAGDTSVGQSSPGRVPVWGQVLGDSRPSAGMLEGSAGSVLGDKENGLARRSEQNGVVSGSGIPEITKRLKAAGTAVIDDNGEPILLTHWTPNMDFTEFGEGDVGFHFGSREQAENRAEKQAGSSNAGRYIQAYLDIKNPAYVQTDGMGWNAAQAAYALSRWGGIITFDDFLTIQQMAISENVKANDSSGGSYNTESSKALRDLLESYGYDGIVYENEFEGEGKSYVAFHPEQVIWIDDGTGRGGDTDRLRPMSGQDSVASVPQDTDSSAGNIRGQDVFPIPEGEGAESLQGPTESELLLAVAKAQTAQKEMDSMLNEIAVQLGVRFTNGTSKSLSSMRDKINRKLAMGRQYGIEDVKDHARNKLELDTFDQIPQVLEALKQKNIPYQTEAVGPTEWGYKGFHITWQDNHGVNCELQLTRPDVWQVKLESDAIYEKWRNVTDRHALSVAQYMKYWKDRKRSQRLWSQLDLPDFSIYCANSSSESTRAWNSSSAETGFSGLRQTPLTSSNVLILGSSKNSRIRPSSVMQAMGAPPRLDSNYSVTRRATNSNIIVPEGEGAEQQRGLAGNTIPQGVEAGTIPEEAAQGIAESERAQYRPVSMDQSQKAAAAGIDAIGGARNAYGELLSTLGKRPLNSTEMAAATQLVQRNDLTVDEKTILLTQVMESATDMGRAINMIKAFSRNTPEGLLYTAQRQIDRWNADMAQGKAPIELSAEEKADLLSLGELISRWDEAGMTVQTRRELLDRVERSMRDKTKKNVEDIVKRAHPGEETDWFTYLSQGIVANKIPSTLADKFRSMQRINLLLQIKTQIRNVGGNFLHSIAETTSDIVATPFDKVLSKVTGVRTVGLPSFRTYANGFSRGLRDVNLARKTGLTNVRGIRQTDGKAVPTTVFQGESKAAQLANRLDNTTSFLLSLGDEGFRRGRENMTRERLRELNPKNNDWVEELAARVGDAATFQEDTALSGALMRIRSAPGQAIRNNGRKNGNGNQTPAEAADILAYAAVPFAKTPANMLVQTARYSPVGLLNGIRQVVKIAVDAKRGKTITPQQQRQAVDALGRGIIGSGLTGIGYFLRSFGVATGEENEDPDKAPLDRGFGLLPNSMKIGNYTIDFSSMAPIPVAINLGASIYNELHKEGLDDPTALGIIETVLSAPINDLTEDSLWQGLTSFVSTASSQGLPAALRDVTLDGISQAIPFNSFLRAVTGVIDPYVRETSAETAIGQWWNQTKAQLPGLSLTLPVRYDSMGNPMTRTPADGVAGRIFHSIINPVTVARDTTDDPVYQMLSELHEQTGRTDIFPQVSPYGLTYGGQKYDIAGADRSRFQQTQGQTAAEMLYDLANAPSFQQMDANEQAEVVADALGYGRDLAKIEYLDNLKIPYEGESLSRKINKLTDQGVPPSAVLVVGAADNTNTIVNGESQKNSGGAKVAKTISQLNITDRQKMALASEFCGKEIQAAMQVALDTGANQPAMMDLLVSISNADTDETPYPATAKAQLVYHAAGLTMEQKKAFSDEFIKDGVDYTSEESAIITSLSASAQSKWVKAKEWGFTPLQYSEYVKAANTSGKKVDKLQALQELFEAEYGSEINSARWAEQFYALMHTKRYD